MGWIRLGSFVYLLQTRWVLTTDHKMMTVSLVQIKKTNKKNKKITAEMTMA